MQVCVCARELVNTCVTLYPDLNDLAFVCGRSELLLGIIVCVGMIAEYLYTSLSLLLCACMI